MNTTIVLQKCIEELGKEKPDLSYVRGMLETVVALSDVKTVIKNEIIDNIPKGSYTTKSATTTNEDPIPEFLKPGRIGGIS